MRPWRFVSRKSLSISAAVWLLAVISLALWWRIHGLRLVRQMGSGQTIDAATMIREEKMIRGEGAFLILSLAVGGSVLLLLITREEQRHRRAEEFFATFSHELKTPLASLRLQAESLQEDLGQSSHERLVNRLVGDTVRLEVQLENALFLAGLRGAQPIHIVDVHLKELLQKFADQWPELEIRAAQAITVRGDGRALEGVFKNLFQNARFHGRAKKITVTAQLAEIPQRRVTVTVIDDGRGFSGDARRLGTLFFRPTSQSGNGVGLYLVAQLVKKMGGDICFKATKGSGFEARMSLPGKGEGHGSG